MGIARFCASVVALSWPAFGPSPLSVQKGVTLDVSGYLPCGTLEFSHDGSLLCAWKTPDWRVRGYPEYGNLDEEARATVFDLSGTRVEDGTDGQSRLADKFIDRFPQATWRIRFSEFIRNAAGFDFTPDRSLGFRLTDPETHDETDNKAWKAELWQMNDPRKRLWRVELPSQRRSIGIVSFFEEDDKQFILVAFRGSTAYVLSRDDGALAWTIDYARDAASQHDSFGSSSLSFEPTRKWIACADERHGRMIRILSIDLPNKIIHELNTSLIKYEEGGVWYVDRADFAANRYLVAKYQFAGRSTKVVRNPIEILRIGEWTQVLQENLDSASAIAISRNGKWLAVYRSGACRTLTIKPFAAD